MLRTPLCSLFGIEYPLVSAPMGPDLSDVDLVAAVSGAGALGILQAQLAPPHELRSKISEIRRRTERPFGVNFLLAFPWEDGLEVCLEEKVPLISLFWGDPHPIVPRCRDAGVRVAHQVGSVREAHRAAAAGVDLVIAQGTEAGGHVSGDVGTLVLVPRVVDAVAPTPVAAAGGIADARGIIAALALGAQAAVLGTRFLAAAEANVHPEYQRRVVEATEDDTLRTTLFDAEWPGAPHRVLRTPLVTEWSGRESEENRHTAQPEIGSTTLGGNNIRISRFMGFPPNRSARGDIASMSLLSGQGAGLVDAVEPAAKIVADLVSDASSLLQRLTAPAPVPAG